MYTFSDSLFFCETFCRIICLCVEHPPNYVLLQAQINNILSHSNLLVFFQLQSRTDLIHSWSHIHPSFRVPRFIRAPRNQIYIATGKHVCYCVTLLYHICTYLLYTQYKNVFVYVLFHKCIYMLLRSYC